MDVAPVFVTSYSSVHTVLSSIYWVIICLTHTEQCVEQSLKSIEFTPDSVQLC